MALGDNFKKPFLPEGPLDINNGDLIDPLLAELLHYLCHKEVDVGKPEFTVQFPDIDKDF